VNGDPGFVASRPVSAASWNPPLVIKVHSVNLPYYLESLDPPRWAAWAVKKI
jgi:hypothetical protein